MKIAVYGANAKDVSPEIADKARQIGREIAKRGHTIITGACAGLPHKAVLGAREHGGEAIGFSPATDMKSHEESGNPTEGFSRLVFIPKDFGFKDNIRICRKYRNVSSVANSDAAIIINGRTGTLNEFTIAYDSGKRIGILKGSGGIADNIIPQLLKPLKKDTGAVVIFDSEPASLVERLSGPEDLKQ